MALKKISSIILLCAVTMGVMAVPARREGVIRTAEDGTEKLVFLHGDAFFHYMTDEQGTWLDEKTLQPLSETKKAEAVAHGKQVRKAQQAKQALAEPNIAPRGLLILVNFKDQMMAVPRDTIDSMLNGANFSRSYNYSFDYHGDYYEGTVHASGSARKYFQDQSYGQYNPHFDVVGPYTLKNNTSYYGSNNDAKAGEMIQEACQLAHNDGVNFANYDNDSNNVVDFVYVYYAGEGEADGGPDYTIWPHKYDLDSRWIKLNLDGKKVNTYACSNEVNHYSQTYNGIGTFVHEFSHVMGLPDLYETNDPSTGLTTLNEWDILDYGPYNNDGNTPPAYSAYERFFCGWLTPRILTEAENVTLQVLDSAQALLVCAGDQHNLVGYNPNPKTFYLLEARNQTGWDAYLPGEGMLITKIKFSESNWINNQVNNSASNMGVDLMEATPNSTLYGEATDAYPAGATSWTDLTEHEVTDITRDAATGIIRFKYRGGKDTTGLNETPSETQKARKELRDGKIVIIRGDKEYDILGHENHQL